MRIFFVFIALFFNYIPYGDFQEYHYDRPLVPLQVGPIQRTGNLQQSYTHAAPIYNTIVQDYLNFETTQSARQPTIISKNSQSSYTTAQNYQHSSATYNQRGSGVAENVANVALSYHPQQQQYTPNLNPFTKYTQVQQHANYVNLPLSQQQYSQQNYANGQRQNAAGAIGGLGYISGTNDANFGTGGWKFGTSASNFDTGGTNFGAGVANFGTNVANFGTNVANFGTGGANFGNGDAKFGSGGANFGTNSAKFGTNGAKFDTNVANFGSEGVGNNGFRANVGGNSNGGANFGANGQSALNGKNANLISQSEAGQLHPYQHQQKPTGNNVPFPRQVTHCIPNGQCQSYTLAPGQLDLQHLRNAAFSRAKTQPTSEKCRLIAWSKQGYSYPYPANRSKGYDYGVKEENRAKKRPPDRRITPYTEITLPKDPYN